MRDPRALRDVLPTFIFPHPDCSTEISSVTSDRVSLRQNIWKSHPLTRLSGAGRTGVGHRRWAQQRTPALRPRPEQHLPELPVRRDYCPSDLLPGLGNALCLRALACPAEAALAARQNQGGAGGIISDLAGVALPQHPVCARHTVRTASLARRRLRLTPEVNSGCLPAVGATV